MNLGKLCTFFFEITTNIVDDVDLLIVLTLISVSNDCFFAKSVSRLYPFVPDRQFNDAAAKLEKALSQIQPFKIQFQEISHFNHGANNTFFLKPNVTVN